jgi:endoglucanase
MPRLTTARVTACLAGVLLLATTGCGSGESSGTATPPSGSSPSSSGSAARMSDPEAFLSGYVTSDGRVLRHDQGDDIVSEGQAYGMLAAELAGRDDVVRSIWTWTRQHLQNSDGLLAFHADSQGKVLDRQPATDADVLAAYALLRYDGTDAGSLHADGRALASAVLTHETVTDNRGRPVLVAGPWATSGTLAVDPSYLMPSVFSDLARMTGEQRWQTLATSSVDLVDQMTQQGQQLPPDWARLEGDRLVPSGSGGGDGSPQYGPDAQRVPLWFAAGCDDRSRRLAGAWWSLLQQDDRSSAGALSLDGDAVDPAASTVALLASGAAARAAGDAAGAAQLESGAGQTNDGQPSYYGAAWLVLAAGLRDSRLTSCG